MLRDKLNHMIVNQHEIKSYFAERSTEITNIKSPTAYLDEIKEFFQGDYHKGLLLPWANTHDHFRIRPAEVTIWGGYSGGGKSLLLSQIMMNLIRQQQHVLLASLELRPVASCQRAIRQTLGGNNPTEEYINQWLNSCDQKLYIYDQQGVTTPNAVLEVIYYAVEQLKCTQIILDSLMKCGVSEDDYQAQKEFIDTLCIAARDLKCSIHLVAHARKRSDDQQKSPSKHDIAGSTNITNLADNVFIVHRTHKEQQLMNGTITDDEYQALPSLFVNCVKQRHYEWEGQWPFWFDPEALRFNSSPALKKHLITLP